MRAITIWQPWASLISWGAKEYETRSWAPPAKLQGKRIAIHAAARRPTRDDLSQSRLLHLPPDAFPLPRGEIVATAVLTSWYECRALMPVSINPIERQFGDFGPGRYAWRLGFVMRLRTPIDCRGYQGFWTVPQDIEELITREHSPWKEDGR